jgi:predicted dinucleotide-utilizing enzyme
MKRVGLIGCGAIGHPVARARLAGTAGAQSLTAVLARAARQLDGFEVMADDEAFLAGRYDLIIETAGPPPSAPWCRRRSSAARCGR